MSIEVVMGNNRAQSSSIAPVGVAEPRGVTIGIGRGTNLLYAINSCQDKAESPQIVTGML